MGWFDDLNRPHGRDEKTKNQTNTFPVQPLAADLQPVSLRVIARAVLDAAPPRFGIKAKRFTEGNEGNEEFAHGFGIKASAPFVSFVSFC